MAEENKNGVNAPEENKKKGFFGKVKDTMSDFSEKHPKVTKVAKTGVKIAGGVALIITGAFVGGVATGIAEERRRAKSETTESEEPVVENIPVEEAPAEEAEVEADEASFEDNAPEEEQAEE